MTRNSILLRVINSIIIDWLIIIIDQQSRKVAFYYFSWYNSNIISREESGLVRFLEQSFIEFSVKFRISPPSACLRISQRGQYYYGCLVIELLSGWKLSCASAENYKRRTWMGFFSTKIESSRIKFSFLIYLPIFIIIWREILNWTLIRGLAPLSYCYVVIFNRERFSILFNRVSSQIYNIIYKYKYSLIFLNFKKKYIGRRLSIKKRKDKIIGWKTFEIQFNLDKNLVDSERCNYTRRDPIRGMALFVLISLMNSRFQRIDLDRDSKRPRRPAIHPVVSGSRRRWPKLIRRKYTESTRSRLPRSFDAKGRGGRHSFRTRHQTMLSFLVR